MSDSSKQHGKPDVTCQMIHPQLTQFLESIGSPTETILWRDLMSPLEDQLRSCLMEEILARFVPEADVDDEITLSAPLVETLVFISISLAFLSLRDQIANNLDVPEESKYPSITDNLSDS